MFAWLRACSDVREGKGWGVIEIESGEEDRPRCACVIKQIERMKRRQIDTETERLKKQRD